MTNPAHPANPTGSTRSTRLTRTTRLIMLGTAGHVDHGKTALVKLLTGCETDRLAEEKRRGLTIELGYAPCKLADERIAGVIDAPGHVDFIRNMAAGAHAVDLAILCVAADDGVMPQTREHVAVLQLMGVTRAVVALTRSDLVDEDRIASASDEVRQLLSGSPLADSPVCPLSNITGEGFSEFMATLLDRAADFQPGRPAGGFRMWIDRTFNVKGFGLVATGIPTTGEISAGDKLYIPGRNDAIRVRNLQVYGVNRQQGSCGQCVALNLSDINSAELDRGILLSAHENTPAGNMFEALLEILPTAEALSDYTRVHLHIGSARLTGAVALLEGKPVEPGPDGKSLVQLRLDSPVPAAPGERFIIRAQQSDRPLTTIGGGVVLDACGLRLKRRRPWTLKKLSLRRQSLGDPAKWLEAILSEQTDALNLNSIASTAWLTHKQTQETIEVLLSQNKAKKLDGDLFVSAALLASIADRIDKLTKESPEIPLSLAMENIGLSEALFHASLGILKAANRVKTIKGVDGRILLTAAGGEDGSETTQLSPAAAKLEKLLLSVAMEPPLPGDMAATLGLNEKDFLRALADLAAAERCVQLDRKVIMHTTAIQEAKNAAIELFRDKGFFDTVCYRDRLGISRKYAIALLDWFDTQRFTTRNGQFRRPGVEARKLLQKSDNMTD